MSVPFYPPPSFCFALSFDRSGIDASFHEISGLKVNWTYDEVEEGGQNRFVHKLPKRTEHSNLILKRGVLTSPSPLAEWLKTAFAGAFYAERAQPKTLTVQLRNALGPGATSVVLAAGRGRLVLPADPFVDPSGPGGTRRRETGDVYAHSTGPIRSGEHGPGSGS